MLLASEVGARMPYFRHISASDESARRKWQRCSPHLHNRTRHDNHVATEKNCVLFFSFTNWREGTSVPRSRRARGGGGVAHLLLGEDGPPQEEGPSAPRSR